MLSLPITAGDNFDVANLTETPHRMSALGHKRTFCDAGAMSALPPNLLQNSIETTHEQ